MTRQAEGTFHVEAWDEAPYAEFEGGGKLTRASVTQRYEGAIEERGTVEYLMCHAAGDAARFVAHEHVQGMLGGRESAFEGGVATSDWEIVPGSGTGGSRASSEGASSWLRAVVSRSTRSSTTSHDRPVRAVSAPLALAAAALCAALTVAACRADEPRGSLGEARVPLVRAHGLLFLDVEVQDGAWLALLDTGANASAVDPRRTRELPSLGTVDVVGTTGVLQAELVELAGLSLGGFALPTVRATRRDLGGLLSPDERPVDLILGTDALAALAVTLDFDAQELRARRVPAPADARGPSVALVLDEGIPAIPAEIGGLALSLRLDTGASLFASDDVYVNLPPLAWRALHERLPELRPIALLGGTGASGERVDLPVVEVEGARVGPLALEHVRVIEQPAAGYFEREDAKGFVGVNLLEKLRVVTLDLPRNRLYAPGLETELP